MKHTKQLFLLLLLAIVSNVAAGNVTDELTWQILELPSTNNGYNNFSSISVTSNAVYAGNAASNTGTCIQLRTTNNNSGIVTTTSGGKIVSVEIEWATNTTSGRVLDVYGKNSAYSAASDLYNTSKQGTKLGSFTYSSSTVQTATLEVSGDYQYIGIRSKSGALYLNYIKITWSNGDSYSITPQSNNTDYGTVSISGNTITATPAAGYQVSTTNPYTVTSGTATVEQDGNTFTVTPSENCTVQINFEAIPVVTHLYIKADSAPYVYTWTGPQDSATKYTGDWPGTLTSTTSVIGGISWYTIEVQASGFNVIFHDNGGHQTVDINGISKDTYFVWNSSADEIGNTGYQIVSIGEISATDLQLTVGGTGNSNITNDLTTCKYSSSDTGVATVADDGTVTGVSAGNAVITVYCPVQNVGGTYYVAQTTFNVTVTEAAAQRTYVKVTSTEDIENGKKYLIVYEEGSVAFDGSLSTLDAASNNQEVVINDNTITTNESIYFTINEGSIRSASGKYIGRSNNNNGMDISDSPLSNNISISDGNAIIVGDGGAYLRYNSNSDQKRFRYFSSSGYSNQKAIQLYKEGTVNHEVTLYVKADSAPYIYTWTGPEGSETKYSGNWPGTQATGTEEVNGVTWYKYTVPAKGFNLILNTGDGTQTSDINNITEDKFIVWNSAADGYAANQYLFVDFATVSAQAISVRAGKTIASNVTTTPEGLTLTYQSGDTSKATVDSNGTITGVAEGTAIVTVSWNTQEVGGQGYLGGSTTLTVTVTPASTSSDVFVKATSESDLQDGMQVIIVNDTHDKVMGQQKENNFDIATVEIDKETNPYEAIPDEHATILTLEGSNGAWYFKDEHDKYLYAASSSSNHLKTQTEKNDNAKAKITFSNGDAAIVFQGSYSRNILRYNGNATSGLFSCYASGQNPVQIYYRESQTIVARPTIDPANGTYTEAQTVTITNNAEGATVYYTTDGSTPTAESTQYTAPFVLRQNGTHTIKAIAISNDGKSSVATSTITINIEIDAPEISPATGTQITEETPITITGAEGTTIYYTTDGSDPVKDGALTGTAKAYTGAFTLTKAGTVKAVARDAGGNFSEIVLASYTFNGTVSLPYYERFDEGLGNFLSVSTGTLKWNFRSHDATPEFLAKYGEERKYAYASRYQQEVSTKTGMARLVSPIIDLTNISNAQFSFIHAGASFTEDNKANTCKVQIITDDGGKNLTDESVLTTDTNWESLTIPNWFETNATFPRTNSGDIDLSAYKDKKVRICFLYDATQTSNFGNWNVDQISIRGEVDVEIVNIPQPSGATGEGYTTYVTKNDIDAATTLTNKDVKLYKVVEFDRWNVVLVQLGLGTGTVGENTYSETVIPAETPILVKGEFGERELVLVNSSEVIPKLRGNLLRSAVEGVKPTADDAIFVLQYPQSVGAYGFHKLSTGRKLEGRKAYLNGVDEVETLTTQTNSAKGVFLFGEEEDVLPLNIQQLDVHASSVTYSDGIFDLMGRKVNTSNGHLPKGIYVVKGKKFVVK